MSASDPFAVAGDPRSYVPRQGSEEALAALSSFLRIGATQIVLRGPEGIGKSLLLRVIASRLSGALRVVEVPYPALSAEEIAPWILNLMGEVPASDPERELVARARELREQRSGLAVLIDDAESTPLPTLRRLSRIAGEARPALRLVLALPDDHRADTAIEAIGPVVEVVSFADPMTEAETRAYLDGHLARAQVPEADRRHFVDALAGAIHRESSGFPGAVSRVARRWWEERSGASLGDPGQGGGLASGLLGGDPQPFFEEIRSEELGAPPSPAPDPGTPDAADVLPPLPAALPLPTASVPPVPPRPPGPGAGPEPEAASESEAPPPRLDWLPPSSPASPEAPGTGRRVGPWLAAAGVACAALWLGRVTASGPGAWPLDLASAFERGTRVATLDGSPSPASPVDREDAPPAEPGETAAGERALAARTETEADPVPSTLDLPDPTSLPPVGAPPPGLVPTAAPSPSPAGEGGAPEADPSLEGDAGERAAPEASSEPTPPDRAPAPVPTAEVAAPALVAVSINAVPWARILIDGVEVGVTPLADLEVDEGVHEFRARFGDGREEVRVVRISPQNRRVVFR